MHTLSPAPSKNHNPYAHKPKKGNSPTIANNTASSLTNKTIPDRIESAEEYMAKHIRDARFLSQGVSGSAYAFKMTPARMNIVQGMYKGLNNTIKRIDPHTIPLGTHIVIKIMTAPKEKKPVWDITKWKGMYIHHLTKRTHDKESDPEGYATAYNATKKTFVNTHSPNKQVQRIYAYISAYKRLVWDSILTSGAEDATYHKFLMDREPLEVPCPSNASQNIMISPNEYVPEFYFSGSDQKNGVYIIIMGFVDGAPLNSISMTPSIVAHLERAFIILKIFGLEHGDAHTGNIIVQSNGHIKVIDFGLSIVLPDKYRIAAHRSLAKALHIMRSSGAWPDEVTNALWYNAKNGNMKYTNSKMIERGYVEYYNPSGKLLLYVKKLIQGQSKKLHEARIMLWGSMCRGNKKRQRIHTNLNALIQPKKQKKLVLNYGNL